MIIQNVNPIKLLNEFTANGVIWTHASNNLNYIDGKPTTIIGDVTVEFAEGADMDLAQQIVDAHDPTPIPPVPSDTEALTNYILDVDMRLVMVEMGLL